MRKSFTTGSALMQMVVLLCILSLYAFPVRAVEITQQPLTATATAVLPQPGERMVDYMQRSRDLVTKKQYEAALPRYEWFYAHALDYELSMGGVRNTFFLSYWAEFAAKYPPAMAALTATRDRKYGQFNKGDLAGGNPIIDVFAIDRVLGDDDKSVALFEQLDKTQPDLAKRVWLYVKDAVIKAERFDLVRKYIGPLDQEYNLIMKIYTSSNARPQGYKEPAASEIRKAQNRYLVEKVVQLLWVAKNLGETEAGKNIQAQALTVVNDPVIILAWP